MDIPPLVVFLAVMIVLCCVPALGLRRSWAGLGLAWLGSLLGAGLAAGIGYLYVRYVHVQVAPRNDSDWSGVGAYIFWLFVLPCAGAIGGLVLGYRYAFRRERGVPPPPPPPAPSLGLGKPFRSDPG